MAFIANNIFSSLFKLLETTETGSVTFNREVLYLYGRRVDEEMLLVVEN